MKHLKLAAILWFILLPVVSSAANDGYDYPMLGPYEATILGTPNNLKYPPPERILARRIVLDIIPDGKKPDIFFYNDGLRCTLAYQDKQAPLVFLIAGTGANDQSQKVLSIMKALYSAGFHVITLPSPTHPNFVISASRTHVPGDLTEDAADLYVAMEHAWNKVKGDVEVSGFYLGGYSLGGTHAAFVAKLDEERKIFNFRKVLMVNPAVNLYNSVTKVDGLLEKIPGGQRKIGAYFNAMFAKFAEFYRKGDFIEINDEFLYTLYKSKLFSDDENCGLIGLSFRTSLAGMVFASDVMTNGGYVVPKNRELTATDPLENYLFVYMHLSFMDYFDEYFYPYKHRKYPDLTRNALIDSLSLKSIEEYLKSSSKIGAITNDDDFILASGEIDYLRQLLEERLTVYPRGGHLGNLEYRDNMINLIGFFK
ncbi:MAG TPA: alpha/beta fold hydrolase [Methanoregulaceae archaeon]|nr:alpha/beta fold hydrolase [Bacteroidales bacterium]HQM56727.1 alpha/beta fold hydrolase [Methanoregulaceae archaeon]